MGIKKNILIGAATLPAAIIAITAVIAAKTGPLPILWAGNLALAVLVAGAGFALAWHIGRLFELLRRDLVIVFERHPGALNLAPSRHDEFGPVAKALEMFRAYGGMLDQMQAQQNEMTRQAEAERHKALSDMADAVELETNAAVERLAQEGDRVKEMAVMMAGSARIVSADSQEVATAATQAMGSARAVSEAAGQLTESIHDIADQVRRVGQTVDSAVTVAKRAGVSLQSLSQAMGEVDAVAGMIGAIASQTNLLALNATIEAARAGEAGRGFAVVANEVKNLAGQTAHSTQDIASRIAALQDIFGQVVTDLDAILGVIHEINQISASVGHSVARQDAATREIAANVQQTSRAACEVSERICEVAGEARGSGESAGQVQVFLDAMAGEIHELRVILNRVVRTAAPDVNRRVAPRVKVDTDAVLSDGHGQYVVHVDDLSAGGSRLAGPAGFVSDHGTLHIDGLDRDLPFNVVENRPEMLRIRFSHTDAERAGLSKFVLAQQRGSDAPPPVTFPIQSMTVPVPGNCDLTTEDVVLFA